MKVAVLMLSSNNNNYEAMVNACRETWINDAPENTRVFYSYGRGHKDHLLEGLGGNQYTVTKNDEIIVNSEEGRERLLQKTIKGFEYLLDQNFDYVVRTNCGSYINLHLLNRFLSDKPRTGYYSGINGFVNGIKFASGACIKMSKDVVELLVEGQDKLEYNGHILMDDVSIGKFLFKNNVKLQNDSQRIDSFPHDIIHLFDKDCYHHYFRHSDDENVIYRCHELFKYHGRNR